MIDYYNNTNAISAYTVKVIACVTFVVNLRYERMNIAFDERPKRFGGIFQSLSGKKNLFEYNLAKV